MSAPGRLLMLALSSLALSCGGDDEATGPTPNELIGSWDAVEIELTSVADPGLSVELIALGANGRLVLQSNGDYGLSVGIPGEPTEFAGGTWSAANGVLTLVFDTGDIEGTWRFNYVLAGDTLSLTGADVEYDFNGDDLDELATLDMTMARL